MLKLGGFKLKQSVVADLVVDFKLHSYNNHPSGYTAMVL